MSINPSVSVVMPIYNVADFIEECTDSLLSQQMSDFEAILVDDGSRDGSPAILDEYAQKDARIIVVHKANGGVSAARNIGLASAAGTYLYVMDSDDILEPNTLGILLDTAKDTDADVVIADHVTFRESGEATYAKMFSHEFCTSDQATIDGIQSSVLHRGYSPYPSPEYYGLGIAPPWTKLVKRSLVRDNGLSFDSYVEGIFDDGLFCIGELQFAKKVAYVSACIYRYRIRSSSLIHRYNPRREAIHDKVFDRIESFQKQYDRRDSFTMAFYARVVVYIIEVLKSYYLHDDYDGTFRDAARGVHAMYARDPYVTALRAVDMGRLSSKQKIIALLGRMKAGTLTLLISRMGKK